MNKKIIIPILNNEYPVIVCWGDTKFIKQVLKKYGHKYDDEDFNWDKYGGRFFGSEGKDGVVVLPKKPKTPEDIGNLAHEATHAVVDIFEFIGEEKYDEVFAHSVGAIVREALEG